MKAAMTLSTAVSKVFGGDSIYTVSQPALPSYRFARPEKTIFERQGISRDIAIHRALFVVRSTFQAAFLVQAVDH